MWKFFSMSEEQKELWEFYLRNLKSREDKIYPSPDLFFYRKSNPLFSGMNSLKLAIDIETLGIEQANVFFSVGLIAHTYNAARAIGYLEESWPALETVMEYYRSELFSGSLPAERHQLWKRWLLVTRIPATMLAQNKRPQTIASTPLLNWRWGSSKAEVIARSKVAQHISEYIEEQSTPLQFLFDIYTLKNTTKTAQRSTPSLQKLIGTLRDVSAEELPRIEIEWTLLNQQCGELLNLIRDELAAVFVPRIYDDRVDERSRHLYMINDIFGDAFGSGDCDCLECERNNRKKGKKIKKNSKSVQLELDRAACLPFELAAKAMKAFIPEANKRAKVKPFDVRKSVKGRLLAAPTDKGCLKMQQAFERMNSKEQTRMLDEEKK